MHLPVEIKARKSFLLRVKRISLLEVTIEISVLRYYFCTGFVGHMVNSILSTDLLPA